MFDLSRPLGELLQHAPHELLAVYDAHSNLTRPQLFFWVTHKLQPALPLYNTAFFSLINGHVDLHHFQRAFQALIQTSDSLRTIFVEKDGIPQQQFAPSLSYTVEHLDLSRHADPLQEALHLAHLRLHRCFDFSRRLFDTILFKLTDTLFVWYYSEHHIIADAWSQTVLYRRMIELYELAEQRRLDQMSKYPQFQEYVQYEQAYRSSTCYKQAEEYWPRKNEAPLELGLFAQNNRRATAGKTCCLSYLLPEEQHQRIRLLAEDPMLSILPPDMKLFLIYTALVGVYLACLTKQPQIAIATTFSNRSSTTLREITGLLYKENILRLTLAPEDSLLTLIPKVRAEVAEVAAHYRNSLFFLPPWKRYSLHFLLQNSVFQPVVGFGGATISTHLLATDYNHDSLYLHVEQTQQEDYPTLHFTFREDVFDEQQRQQLFEQFKMVMQRCLTDPHCALSVFF